MPLIFIFCPVMAKQRQQRGQRDFLARLRTVCGSREIYQDWNIHLTWTGSSISMISETLELVALDFSILELHFNLSFSEFYAVEFETVPPVCFLCEQEMSATEEWPINLSNQQNTSGANCANLIRSGIANLTRIPARNGNRCSRVFKKFYFIPDIGIYGG